MRVERVNRESAYDNLGDDAGLAERADEEGDAAGE